MIDKHEEKLAKHPGHNHFTCYVNDNQYTYIMSDIINHIVNQEDEDIV